MIMATPSAGTVSRLQGYVAFKEEPLALGQHPGNAGEEANWGSYMTLTFLLSPPRGDPPGPTSKPQECHCHAEQRGLISGRVVGWGALPALHQPHLPGVLGMDTLLLLCPGSAACGCWSLCVSPPQDYSKCKQIMIERGELFTRRISLSREKIAHLCHTFIKDGAVRTWRWALRSWVGLGPGLYVTGDS